eukprot:1163156-Alexandrium_andersonii.AAC.1
MEAPASASVRTARMLMDAERRVRRCRGSEAQAQRLRSTEVQTHRLRGRDESVETHRHVGRVDV